jgi:hypothetical protein
MDKVDEVNNRRGRKKKNTGRETQHVVYVDPDVWEAANDLPISRPDIIREALANAISFYKTDLPKLKMQLGDIRTQIQSLQAKEAVILSRIEQLEAKAVFDINEQEKADELKEVAIKETLTMCRAFKKNMQYSHYTKLSELSGVEAAKIEVFLKDSKFRPSEEAVRVFYMG